MNIDEDCICLLNDALKTKDLKYVLTTLCVLARYKGMSKIAKESNTNRAHLYKILSENGNPSAKKLMQIMDVLGIELSATLKKHNNLKAI
nr:addiction module antidote protein [Anaerobiospirillum thomasii]